LVQSKAQSVPEYLKSLPEERRAVIAALRKVIRANLPAGYAETMSLGMISYEIPLKRYPKTYNGQPLALAGLAAQKNNYALYLMCMYIDPKLDAWFRGEFKKAGKKLDMGKSCVRFKKLDDLPLETIGQLIAKVSVDDYLERYESVKGRHG
jgi:hypothetical protein